MTPDLEEWLQRATRKLSEESASKVRAEIQEHYESAREAAIESGALPDETHRVALSALGDAKIANRQYRRVLLTASEMKIIQDVNRGTWIIWRSSGRRGQVLAESLLCLLAAVALFRSRWVDFGYYPLASGLGMGFDILLVQLPVYTPSRARVFRYAKWIVHASLLLLAFHSFGNIEATLGTMAPWIIWNEWKRASVRRKLPVADWPRHLYL